MFRMYSADIAFNIVVPFVGVSIEVVSKITSGSVGIWGRKTTCISASESHANKQSRDKAVRL